MIRAKGKEETLHCFMKIILRCLLRMFLVEFDESYTFLL